MLALAPQAVQAQTESAEKKPLKHITFMRPDLQEGHFGRAQTDHFGTVQCVGTGRGRCTNDGYF